MLARAYRPKQFSELVGQEALKKSLSYALDNSRIAQAFLFSGLRGSGKTTSARILSRCLNCEQGISSTPCGVCSSCTNPSDVYELDAASNRGIDAILELIESTKYAPLGARFKIYIIDEVHMLTKEAFNALLKTLEEPPAYVKFILATTDPAKLPATILSRLLHFRFKKIPANLIAARLGQICAAEHIVAEPAALLMLANAGGGSMRDSLTLLDQALLFCGGEISSEQISSMLGLLDGARIKELLTAISADDEAQVEKFLSYAKDYEAKEVLDGIKSALKDEFYSNSGLFDAATYERFFAILARSYRLASACDDDEFALNLCVLSMSQAAFASDYAPVAPAALEPKDDAQALFSELMRASCEKDALFGELLIECMRLDGLDDECVYLCFNPKNSAQAADFKQAYAAWWKQLAQKITKRKLKITSESAAKLEPAAPAPATPKSPVADIAPAPATPKSPAADIVQPATPAPAPQPLADDLPSYQVDEFDGALSDDEADFSDIASSDEAFAGLSELMIDLIFSHIELSASPSEVVLNVCPPASEPELSTLRAATKIYLANLKQLYSQPVVVKKKLI